VIRFGSASCLDSVRFGRSEKTRFGASLIVTRLSPIRYIYIYIHIYIHLHFLDVYLSSLLYEYCIVGDGKCVICDSYVRPCTLVRICDECNYGSYQGRCVICGGPGVSDAYYCKECTITERDVRCHLSHNIIMNFI